MSDMNVEPSQIESVVTLSETSSAPMLSSSSIDDEARRRRILSKLWGKGNKLSHKVRELDKNTTSNSNDVSIHNDNDQKQLTDNCDDSTKYQPTNDSKSSLEDSSNSINSNKPLAVVKPIVVVKSGLVISCSTDRARVNTEASSTNSMQVDETSVTVMERQSSTVKTERTLNKKNKTHKNKDSKNEKTIRNESTERNRSNHNHRETDKSKDTISSSKNNRQEEDGNKLSNDDHSRSSRRHSSSKLSSCKNNRRSSSKDNRHSNRSAASKKDEVSSSTTKSTSSPVIHLRHHSNSKYENINHQNSSSHHRRRGSPITLSPSSPPRSHHLSTKSDRSQIQASLSPKKDERNLNAIAKPHREHTEITSNHKSTHSRSPSNSYSKLHRRGSDTAADSDIQHGQKVKTSDEQLTNFSKNQKSQEISPEQHRSLSSVVKQDKSKTISNKDKNESNQEKHYSSRYNRRNSSRHRSKSKEKTNRKPVEPLNSDDSSTNPNRSTKEKLSNTVNENSHNDKNLSHRSRIVSPNDDHQRKSSTDYHRHERHDSPSNYDRRNDSHYRHRHRTPTSHSYYPHTHYVHHHHHHHYRTASSRYYDRRRSKSPYSPRRRSRYVSSTSSSLSPSPRRRSSSRTSSSSTRTSSSYSSVSRTSSSRSSSTNNHYYRHDKKFRRSPTLEKIFLKASESIESISTQKNPNLSSSSSTHFIPIQTSTISSDMQKSSVINSLSEKNTFYSENFSGFSVPPPPFISQPQQRCLKEIITESTSSNRPILNEVQTVLLSTESATDEVKPKEIIQSNDRSNNETLVRSSSSKPPRVSRFSDITPEMKSEPVLNTNLPVDTQLNYIQVSENINCLPSSRRLKKRHNREVMECECTTSEYDRSRGIKACGSECLNRMLLIECGPLCPCGQWCTNRRFQRRSYADHKLALFKTEMKGYGLRTAAAIRKGRFLVEYVGEVIDMDELARRNKKYKRDGNTHQYVMSLIHGTVIDSTIKGNWARFINHSCEPNCVAEKWLVNGEYRMGIFAKRDLNINEEITIDYRFETFGTTDIASEKCYCGAPTCRGTISVKNNKNINLNQQQNHRQPLDDNEILEYLIDDNTNEYIVPKTIDDIRQLIQIMSRTDSESVRTIELDLMKMGSQKQFELPRLFLECNGLHVLCSWMKDILIDDEEQQYSNEFKYHLLDFIHSVLPIKDRTIVIKNGLLDLVYQKLKLPSATTDHFANDDREEINSLMNSMLNYLDDPITSKLFHLYSTWISLKERYIIPKRKEPEQTSNHHYRHHHHHHHHSSKYSHEENSHRFNFSSRSSATQQKPYDRSFGKRSYVARDIPRTQEQLLSKDERRKLFEQQYEDAEKARAAAAASSTTSNIESPVRSEPPQKKQRTSDSTEPMLPTTPPQCQSSLNSNINSWTFPTNTFYPHQIDQTYWVHQHLSQIPIDYLHSYMASIGQSTSASNISIAKDELLPPPPLRPTSETELSLIIYLPSGWSVAMCPSDSSVYFYNRETKKTSWTVPSLNIPHEKSVLNALHSHALDLSPLSSAQIHEQQHPHHEQQQQISSSSNLSMKVIKNSHRQSRTHRHHHHHHHHHMSSNNKRKRTSAGDPTTVNKDELHSQLNDETSIIISNEQFKLDEINDKKSTEDTDEISVDVPKVSIDENNDNNLSIITKESSEINVSVDKQVTSNTNIVSSSLKTNRDMLRKNISQHVHATLKPYTKRTCKQGRIISTDDIKYLVKKFTLAVLDKEIEKAKNDGIPLSPILTDRVRLKTEVYVKKYMNKVGPVFQRHDTSIHSSSQPPQQTTTTSNSE